MANLIEVACSCGKTFRAKPEHAGRTGRCGKCGEPITIPALEPEIIEEEEEFTEMPASPVVAPRRIQKSRTVSKPAEFDFPLDKLPGEPFCYWVLLKLAGVLATLSMLSMLASIVLALIAVVRESKSGYEVLGAVVTAISWLGPCIAFAVMSATTYIIVDIARNIRLMRLKSE